MDEDVDWLVMVGGIKDKLLPQVEHMTIERHVSAVTVLPQEI